MRKAHHWKKAQPAKLSQLHAHNIARKATFKTKSKRIKATIKKVLKPLKVASKKPIPFRVKVVNKKTPPQRVGVAKVKQQEEYLFDVAKNLLLTFCDQFEVCISTQRELRIHAHLRGEGVEDSLVQYMVSSSGFVYFRVMYPKGNLGEPCFSYRSGFMPQYGQGDAFQAQLFEETYGITTTIATECDFRKPPMPRGMLDVIGQILAFATRHSFNISPRVFTKDTRNLCWQKKEFLQIPEGIKTVA